jgi:PcfJ-like protein
MSDLANRIYWKKVHYFKSYEEAAEFSKNFTNVRHNSDGTVVQWISLYDKLSIYYDFKTLDESSYVYWESYRTIIKYDYRYCCQSVMMVKRYKQPWKYGGSTDECTVFPGIPHRRMKLDDIARHPELLNRVENLQRVLLYERKIKLFHAAGVSFDDFVEWPCNLHAMIWKLSYSNKNDVRLLRKLNFYKLPPVQDRDFFPFADLRDDIWASLRGLPKAEWPSSDRSLDAYHDYIAVLVRRKQRYGMLYKSRRVIRGTSKSKEKRLAHIKAHLEAKYPGIKVSPLVTIEDYLKAGETFNNCVVSYATSSHIHVFDVTLNEEKVCLGMQAPTIRFGSEVGWNVFQSYGPRNESNEASLLMQTCMVGYNERYEDESIIEGNSVSVEAIAS